MSHSGPAKDSNRLGAISATLLVAGNMIGSGIYLLPTALGAIGSISLFGWLAAALAALAFAAVFAGLSVLRPGLALVDQVTEGLGSTCGALAAWLYWISCWTANVAIALAVTGYLGALFPILSLSNWPLVCTIGVIWLATLANLFGARLVVRLEALTLALGLVPVLALAILGWLWFDPSLFVKSWNVSGLTPLVAVRDATALVFWAFLGLESAAAAAAVVKNPRRNIPVATLGGAGLVALLYIAACTALTGIVSAKAAAGSAAPFVLAFQDMLGIGVGAAVAVCALLRATGTLAGWILVTAETSLAAADSRLFPGFLREPPKRDAPRKNLLITACLMTGVALATRSAVLGEQFAQLINLAVILSLIVFMLACASFVRLSSNGWARATAIAALCFGSAIIASGGLSQLLTTAALVGVAVVSSQVIRRMRRSALAPSNHMNRP